MVHPVLQTTELVTLICSFATHGSHARLARTCRAFLVPALDALWERRTASELFSRILPGVFDIVRIPDTDLYQVNFHRAPTDTEWARLAFYGARIKRLRVEHTVGWIDYALRLSPAVVYAWAGFTGSQPSVGTSLCPRAAHVYWKDLDAYAMQLEGLLWLRPDLPSLHLVMRNTDKAPPEFAHALETLASPSLVKLRVDDLFNKSLLLESALANVVRIATALEVVYLPYASASCVKALAALPALRELYIDRLFGLDDKVDDNGFGALRDLNVPLASHSQTVYFLRKLGGAQNLRSLIIAFQYPYTQPTASIARRRPHEFAGLCDAIARHCNPVGLSSLSILDETYWATYQNDEDLIFYTVKFEHIRPLRALSALKELAIVPWGYIDLDDSQVEELVSAWPHMEKLTLERTYSHSLRTDFPIRATPGSLLTIASRCPHLRELIFSFDASNYAAAEGRPGHGLTQSALYKMDIGGSIWTDESTRALASLLSDVFPSLEHVTSDVQRDAEIMDDEDEVPEALDRWDKLLEMLSFAREIRQQERASTQ
ncbi:uncharacterized protein SCHCODRAFT_02747828 [Schizophyllum commune H4-8]|nr:uncharacterized protein SCHCODRAFT_02747828 [Schizophyllum commune H4-8]KAI5893915.1 hypothetical protein SCHCODRAFT_02747828 [Schizophyllum commune H4-8]